MAVRIKKDTKKQDSRTARAQDKAASGTKRVPRRSPAGQKQKARRQEERKAQRQAAKKQKALASQKRHTAAREGRKDRWRQLRDHIKTPGEVVASGASTDYSLFFIVLFLLAFGLIMLYSTSSYAAVSKYGDSAYYLKRQLIFTVLGLALMEIVSRVPYRLWHKVSTTVYILSVLLVLMIIPFGYSANGATRWLRVGGVSLQPAEVCKIGVILITASLIETLGRKRLRTWKGFIVAMLPSLVVGAMLFLITKNLSSAFITVAVAFCMLFVASPGYKRFAIIVAAVAAAIIAAVVFIARHADASWLQFRAIRVLAWLDPAKYASTTSYQTVQALYAIGSGGFFGKGLGQSVQKLVIPEVQNDMIFSIICEELGLFGAIGIMLMFVLLIWRFMLIANNAQDLYGALLVTGVIAHISVQVLLNIAVVTNTIPNTGVTLPFISYGGSSLFLLLAEVGMVLGVARGERQREKPLPQKI